MAWVTAIATVALVVVTAVLAKTTADYAKSSRDLLAATNNANLDAVRPRIVLALHALNPLIRVVRLTNIGRGTALDISVTLTLHGRMTGGAREPDDVRTWREHVIQPGENHDFLPFVGDKIPDLDGLVKSYDRISVNGTMTDALGTKLEIDVILDDLDHYAALFKDAHEQFVDDPMTVIAKAVKKLSEKT